MKIPLYKSKNRKYLVFAFASLLVGIVSTITISKYLLWEYQTDKFFADSEKIFFITEQKSPVGKFSETFLNWQDYADIPQIINKVSTRSLWDAHLEYENDKYKGTCLVTDSTFFEIFDYPLKFGNPKSVLSNPNNIVITEEYAKKVFGENDPIGKTVIIYSEFQLNYKVAGIIGTPSGNTTMQFDYIVPEHTIKWPQYWSRGAVQWVKLIDKNNRTDVENLLTENYLDKFNSYDLQLVPLNNAYYFDFSFDRMSARHGDQKHLKLLLVILILVFGLSLFNFFSIYALFNTNRKKELGIKKILGAGNSTFFKSSFIENFLICSVAFVVSIFLFTAIYPFFVKLTGKSFVFQFGKDGLILVAFFFLVLTLMILWSVFYTSRISPLLSSNRKTNTKSNFAPFKIITVLQYSISITLLIVTFSLFRQLNFMQKQDLNFSCTNVISLNFFSHINPIAFRGGEFSGKDYYEATVKQRKNADLLKNELATSPLIESYTYGISPFISSTMNWKKEGNDEFIDGETFFVTLDYDRVFNLEIVNGRFFNSELDQDRVQRVVINEAAVRYFGIGNIETEKLSNSSWGGDAEPWEIIGVIKDFHAEHLSRPVSPLIIVYFDDIDYDWFIRYTPGREAETLAYLQELHNKVSPGEEFSYSFMEDELAAIYKNDRIQVKIYTILTLLALFISLMGIAALSLHHAFKRTRETAIRKVNGCSIGEAIYEMIYPYITLVVISFGISCLAGQYFVSEYLKNFANKLPVSYWLFAIAGAIVLLVSTVILFVALFNAAKRNPVESIKVE